jgi:hypothetical protein
MINKKPTQINISIDLCNAAFDNDPRPEIRRILERLPTSLAWRTFDEIDGLKLSDTNGGGVGRVTIVNDITFSRQARVELQRLVEANIDGWCDVAYDMQQAALKDHLDLNRREEDFFPPSLILTFATDDDVSMWHFRQAGDNAFETGANDLPHQAAVSIDPHTTLAAQVIKDVTRQIQESLNDKAD